MSYEKENYVTRDPNPEHWRAHANYGILRHYSHVARGDCGDLGCNHAATTLLLLDFADRVSSITGLDMNEKALDLARATAERLRPTLPVCFVPANLLDTRVDDGAFDFLMSFHTLEHIYPADAPRFVREAFRMLKSGGHFLISIPYDRAYPDPCHVAFYIEDSLRELFEASGFETIECLKDDRWNEKNLLTALFAKPV